MTESEIKDIKESLKEFRAYFISQLKKDLKFPIKCHMCEYLLEKEQVFFQFETVDKWKLIQTDLFQFLKDNPEKNTNEELWNQYGMQLKSESGIFVCKNCLPQSYLNLDFFTIFHGDLPKKFKIGSIKNILKQDNAEIHNKFLQKITEILKSPNKKFQNDIWETMVSSIDLLINIEGISNYLTKWMTLIENSDSLHNSIIYPLSTIGLLIPKTDCNQFSRCLSLLAKQEISEVFHNMAKKEKLDNWYVLLEHLNLNFRKIAFLKIIQNHNTKILEKLFENYVNYSISFQNYLFEEIQSLDDITLWENLIEKIPISDYSNLDKKIQEKFQTILGNYEKEKSEVKELYDIYLKRNREKSEKKETISFRKTALLLTRGYRKIVDQHIRDYQKEFTTFFKKHPEPILGFDIEEIERNMICVMGIKINPDLSTQVTTQVINDIFRIDRSSVKLEKKFELWIENQVSKYVITHGSNSKESNLIKKSNSIYINSEEFLLNILNTQKIDDNYLIGIGLRYFEHYINFNRKGCGIIKHRPIYDLFFDQFLVSLDHHLWKEPQRQCNLCGKTQDVLLYCLEDAFVSILIVVWCVNRGLIPKNQEKFFQK